MMFLRPLVWPTLETCPGPGDHWSDQHFIISMIDDYIIYVISYKLYRTSTKSFDRRTFPNFSRQFIFYHGSHHYSMLIRNPRVLDFIILILKIFLSVLTGYAYQSKDTQIIDLINPFYKIMLCFRKRRDVYQISECNYI